MRALRRIVLEEAVIGTVFLIGAWYLYYLVAIVGLMDYLKDGVLMDYVTGPAIHVEILFASLGIGVLLAVANHLSEVPSIRHRPFGHIILLKAGLYLVGLLLVMALVHVVFLFFLFSLEEIRGLWASMSPRLVFSLAVMVVVSFLGLTFLLEVRRKVGPGNLWALLTGRYHRPRDEERIFLFLDLKGSTGIAEGLGHARYSQFIRHCYHDLTDSVSEFQAQIYQFVGDEVVLTWQVRKGNAERRSLETFFAFQRRLVERQSWYQDEFGVAPEFRGGVEGGVVTATEVGDIKREIAYHGDALNTAARLLEACREYERPVLVSERIRKTIEAEPGLSTDLQGELILRGKAKPVAVYGVERAEAP